MTDLPAWIHLGFPCPACYMDWEPHYHTLSPDGKVGRITIAVELFNRHHIGNQA